MPAVTPERLAELQNNPNNVRNICILAHVDHGKTTLTDALIAINNIISSKQAGKLRYLDSRPDEQTRGITMESSAISLHFPMRKRPSPDAEPVVQEHLINLIDSPGHIDFSSEVSTASRLCDGAVVLVDAVEGVCSQTVTVLRQAWTEKLKTILVINKMDRLITELKMTPEDAYTHLSKLLEQVNAVIGSFYQGARMEEDLNWRAKMEERGNTSTAAKTAAREDAIADQVGESGEVSFEETSDEDLYFTPDKNVIFSSAVDGWAFSCIQLARQYEKLYAGKLNIKPGRLEKVLWGNFYLEPKTGKVLGSKHLKGRNLKPIFVQLVLEQIWKIYDATVGGDSGRGDPVLLDKITNVLGITIPPSVKRSRDPKLLMTTVFTSWIPLYQALLITVVELIPSPVEAQRDRVPKLLADSPGAESVDGTIKDAMINFKNTKSDPVVAYVSKMISVPESELPENRRRPGQMSGEEARDLARQRQAEAAQTQAADGENNTKSDTKALDRVAVDSKVPEMDTEEIVHEREHLIGFARIYCGSLSVGDKLYVIPPKWSPAHPNDEPRPQETTVTALYMIMGRGLESLQTVPAGVVFGIGGLEGKILKSGTLCSHLSGAVNLAGVSMAGKPIVRVALEPVNPLDLDKMTNGLRLLVQSDPCAEYEQFDSGEHVLLTAGELHLERCLTDLQERFAHCEIQAGKPIVPYRETIVRAEDMRPAVNKDLGRGVAVGVTSSKQISIRLRVQPLPAEATSFLVKNADSIKMLYTQNGAAEKNGDDEGDENDQEKIVPDTELDIGHTMSVSEFQKKLKKYLETEKGQEPWKNQVDNIAAFGPRRTGPNLLIDATKDSILPKVFAADQGKSSAPKAGEALQASHFCDKINYAFQLATAQGPLCNEPIQGIAVFVEDIKLELDEEHSEVRDKMGRLTGEIIKTFQATMRTGFLDWSPRIMLATYRVEIQAAAEVLGRVYDVLTRRRGDIQSESMNEGTSFWTIQATLPVAEAFGFADEMRKRTSGAAAPQLVFSGFTILDEDPFWVPFTEDDLEDLGELADRENVAKRYVDGVRRRKGLLVEGRHVATDAEKQKTLKR